MFVQICPVCPVSTGAQALERYNVTLPSTIGWIFILVGLDICWRILGYLAFAIRMRLTRPRPKQIPPRSASPSTSEGDRVERELVAAQAGEPRRRTHSLDDSGDSTAISVGGMD